MTKSPRQYLALLLGYLGSKSFGQLPEISTDEEISRFLFQSGHFSSTKNTAKYAAFMPPRGMSEVSVYRTEGLLEWRRRFIAVFFVEPFAKRKTLACAVFRSSSVLANDLSFVSDGVPDRRHANIVGWGDSKPDRMAKAKALARMAKVHCY